MSAAGLAVLFVVLWNTCL